MLKHFEQIHFIGIAGIGMSGLARILAARGKQVSGSDLKHNALTQSLEAQGAQIAVGHHAEHVPAGTEYVVVSTAISEENPEIQEARARHIPIIHRSEVLNYLLQTSRSLSITGTHGKTTTSALTSLILVEQGLDPTVVIGGEVPQLGTNALAGQGEFIVAEVDESDQSLRRLSSEVAVITNLEVDHLDHYQGLDEIIEAVAEFVSRQPENGRLVVNLDDAGVRLLLERLPESMRLRTLGFALEATDADYRVVQKELSPTGSRFEVEVRGESLGWFDLKIPGIHNIYNALAALSATHSLGVVSAQAIRTALASYQGVKRRFQLIGMLDTVSVIDDYAHHPSEIRATLSTAKLQNRHISVAFQPHRYSRTQALLQDFADSFELADRVILTDIYAASERPEDFQVSILDLVAKTRQTYPDKEVLYFASLPEIKTYLLENLIPDEMVLTIGAGNITDLSYDLVGNLQAKSSDSIEKMNEQKIVYAPVRRTHQERKVV
ncbi:UDP-N-acetylmuramate--L-alanine ligase [bacterium (Candidatus Blackallbacteria) CG17_big_fil_post_rev_8_21_14_2_50_48_46]|uniref:UDP-N-acetylmuramate--L-alanine ligase n=1 Tax=bacterium (Candidatus Blackallbacteria) CG17_big_fil_post_rev_8_21_14_2_50_48_46 TaxID=2014261 RepID=A0A2M7FWU0_9BACT|nr:MAG: UDP-N-acetylmuramate--L-alanine ligase [bacterium (Candidatus Blackallbacteria) CG18_big_fil_WC_8_21_14_2_50_49_26]PIW13711.1 MAG: UDP-N-acetylmuramate--L-alanine ligase [bacterium (Candidatus Blackallbacteria) CG17_big_fil_post_rev_8_21_14_2_50_48_46]PIW44937.1 MAG: UDP-N-acetylmuramate--L-alanine ligase [bacterium (Candidatus Blackallbacteria) CG13_big_fil_rev_8_21_14_2_50_49_14]